MLLQRAKAFLPVGTLLLLRVVLMYIGGSYWVFCGQARANIATSERRSFAAPA
ncbi:hypothetical protein NKJ87_12145 [Mesorhizobium sp. M0027]|uniref:hypothetical protein n=1 Tax=unclassified Mesorhizobium TaxID=325217 RepID=UPI003339D819